MITCHLLAPSRSSPLSCYLSFYFLEVCLFPPSVYGLVLEINDERSEAGLVIGGNRGTSRTEGREFSARLPLSSPYSTHSRKKEKEATVHRKTVKRPRCGVIKVKWIPGYRSFSFSLHRRLSLSLSFSVWLADGIQAFYFSNSFKTHRETEESLHSRRFNNSAGFLSFCLPREMRGEMARTLEIRPLSPRAIFYFVISRREIGTLFVSCGSRHFFFSFFFFCWLNF